MGVRCSLWQILGGCKTIKSCTKKSILLEREGSNMQAMEELGQLGKALGGAASGGALEPRRGNGEGEERAVCRRGLAGSFGWRR